MHLKKIVDFQQQYFHWKNVDVDNKDPQSILPLDSGVQCMVELANSYNCLKQYNAFKHSVSLGSEAEMVTQTNFSHPM